jgi:hypothetical protein
MTSMLVTFHSKAWSSITMFGDIAVKLLKMAGHSGTVPSAMLARDIPMALTSLKLALATTHEEKPEPAASGGTDEPDTPPVGLRLRAFPLIELLTAADRQKSDVMWETGAPLV